ncbi:hypothetical protein HD599_001864 [Conyzicola lurida]|uniref:DUF1648 domain-containing protein n=1 Tax=Conyzicola lurida TaxID=1172621 RepID=A0A841AP64_9MICO|nr:DUF1648 domain-containing protein [Conyzicola lurida]MBB5843541.1 hypothetical protein [Conyzicola lurida]
MTGYTRNERRRIVALGAVLPILFSIVGIVVVLFWSADLPDPIAIHWSASGEADGFGPLLGLVLPVAGFVALFSVSLTVAALVQRAGTQTRFLVGTVVWLAVFLTTAIGGSVWMQRGLADAADAGSVLPWMPVGIVAGLLLAVPAGLLTPRAPLPVAVDDGEPPLELADGERAVWSRGVTPSRGILIFVLAAVAFAAGIVALASTASDGGPWPAFGILAVAVAVVGATMVWRVRVTAAGVSVRSALGFPKFSVPLDQVEAARAVQISPLGDFGGWGLRGSRRRFGIIVRSGEALEIERTNGRSLVVTVADAATAAALVNGLRGRAAAAR